MYLATGLCPSIAATLVDGAVSLTVVGAGQLPPSLLQFGDELVGSPATFPVQVLRGIYLGLLTGLIPALVSWAIGFLFRYVTGITMPAFGVVVLAVGLAGANGGLLAVIDPAVQNSANAVTLVTALVVVMMLSLYGHGKGDQLGANAPRRLSLRSLDATTLSEDVVEFVGGRRRVTVRVVGDVSDVEGYPPLPATLRAEIRDAEFTFPADLPVGELASRVEERLRAEFELAEAVVSVDERARATVAAAPPTAGVSRRVPRRKRAVSVSTLVPTGLARGDEVRVHTDDGTATGTVVSAKSLPRDPGTTLSTPTASESRLSPTASEAGLSPTASESGPSPTASGTRVSPTSTSTTGSAAGVALDGVSDPSGDGTGLRRGDQVGGGPGRVTIATDRRGAEHVLSAPTGRLVTTARGTGREYELLALLRRAGQRVCRVSVDAAGPLVDQTVAQAEDRSDASVTVLAHRTDGQWQFDPDRSVTLSAGDELFVVGRRDRVDAFPGVSV